MNALTPVYRAPLVFDIETTSIKDAEEYVEPVQPPANYKDELKIAQWVAEKRAERIRKAALDPDLARCVCISLDSAAGKVTGSAHDEHAERGLLETFWANVGSGPEQAILIGFGILTYDLRVLLRRSLYLEVKAPPIQMDRYRHPGVIDLMELLSYQGGETYHSLNFYVRRFGLGPFEPDITGESVSSCIAVGDWKTVEEHCAMDVAKCRALAERIGVLERAAA